ncbi:MAG: hypothetical protein ACJ8F1_15490 [Polyangia bacterium]
MSRLLVASAIVALIGARASASRGVRDATGDPAGSGGIEQLVSGGDRLFAIRDGTVLTFDSSGSVIGRCSRLVDVPARRQPRPFRLIDGADVLHDAALPDDDSTLEAEDALDDERGTSRRPALAAAALPARPRALAAADGRAWAATNDGLYRVTPEGCRRAALAGRDLLVLATSASKVVTASADLLFQADATDVENGGSEAWRFRPIAALAARPRALAIDAMGAILVADDRGVTRVDPGAASTRLLDQPAHTVTTCGGTVVALAAAGVYTWDGLHLTRAGDAPPARLLACGTAPRRWVAGGSGVWSSSDATIWTAHLAALGASVTALAVVGGRAWVAADDGLTVVSLETGDVCGAPPPTLDLGPPHRAPNAPPSWVWPEVGALVMADRTGTRRTVTAFLLLRFPFDRPPPLRSDRSAVALQLARRDAALAQTQLATGFGATAATDIVDRDELAARREMAAEERETLR